MAEDIQADVATEQVQPEATQVTFGQGENTDTSNNNNGQVESESINNSWEGDKRFESHWGKDPNKMYESLRYHEKRQGDFDKQINDYKSQVEELQKYKDDYTAMEDLFNHPQIGPDIENVLNKYSNGQEEQVQPQANIQDDRINDLLSWKNSIEQQAASHYETQQQNKAFDSINEYAKSHNIQWDKNQFVNYMQANNFPVETWPIAFKGVASEQIMANTRSKAAEQALSKAQATQSVATGSNKVPVTGNAPKNIDDLKAQLDSVLPG
jgi:vacuolar-type H+-ATPase subunit I/STV1